MLVALAIIFLVAVVLCACNSKSTEHFLNVPRAVYVDGPEENAPGYQYSDSQILSRPNFKAHTQPRFYQGDLVGELRGPMAPSSVQAFGSSPMDYMGMVGESYDTPPELQHLSKDEVDKLIKEKFEDPLQYQDVALPETNMEMMNFGKDPRDPNTFIYDRLIYANQKRRNRTNADLIRGDIPIANINAHKGWNQVSVKPHLDTVVGALGMGTVGAGVQHIGAHYDTSVSSAGDVSTVNQNSEQQIEINSFF